ncbi:basic amino acid ABC transporter substrate-binding protein [Ferrimonas aestuarii]|uniref:Basic amino acid ABC transporter substrate-binding protein n=1 Tax=Ferrimonas aestuarii TaxID=2569539 RepID=A0A4U1BRS4_9GAMM|nr:basic amino acid ABC transporter substrate-binding protein [Ferrimonas aestuarii]TKB57266.1 basic amino acid ABC transporter substrate-binding protein [Ferrimonas aestuarii]
MKKTIAALTLATLTLTGCGSKEEYLVVGTNAEFPPFEYIGGATGDEVLGFDIDLAKQIAADQGKTLKVENMKFDSLIVALNAGKVDMVAAGMTITPERKASVDFSQPYYEATQVVITPVTNVSINSVDDVKGKHIAVQLGSTGDIMAKELSDNVTAFNTGFEAIMELKNGKVDMVLFDSEPAAKHLAKNPQLKMQKLNFDAEYYGLAVAKNNPELLKQINASIDTMKQNGSFDALLAKHMQ